MTLQEPPSAAEARPAYVLEQLPELREQMSKGVDWHKVVERQKADALNDTEEQKRMQAMQLSGVLDLDGNGRAEPWDPTPSHLHGTPHPPIPMMTRGMLTRGRYGRADEP